MELVESAMLADGEHHPKRQPVISMKWRFERKPILVFDVGRNPTVRPSVSQKHCQDLALE